jgi:hypothetical protein
MSIKSILLLLGALTLAGIGWWLMPPLKHPATHALIIDDSSDSTPSDCESMAGIFRRAIRLPGINKHSTITVLLTGDERTANEPRRWAEYKAPDTRYVIEGRRKVEQQQNDLVADLFTRCSQTPVTKVSPIYLALKRGVEQLQSIAGADGSALYLFIKTDGEETAEPQIKAALRAAPGSKLQLPAPIRNEGVHIFFCGMAETLGQVSTGGNGNSRQLSRQRDSQRVDRACEVWTALFSVPTLVTFEPYCPNQGDSAQAVPSGKH